MEIKTKLHPQSFEKYIVKHEIWFTFFQQPSKTMFQKKKKYHEPKLVFYPQV